MMCHPVHQVLTSLTLFSELYPGALDNDDIDRIVNDDDSLSDDEETVEQQPRPRPANRPPPRSPGTPRRQVEMA